MLIVLRLNSVFLHRGEVDIGETDPSKYGSQSQLDQQAEDSCSHTYPSGIKTMAMQGLLKHIGCLNTLHPNPRDEFRTCWGRVEELLVAEELWNDHKKLIFFPVASAATCTDSHLEVDQRRRPCEHDGLIGTS
ncbi:hypothetical protein Taro_037852 [Colocasia esculenta]|uniref:Uncharacterized protein n=1 Tax=Colocasia esculenta TaxID=4460 RepID=A0A843WKH2_COLES|nr:hypothetical protein [Colocasia esculenta]